jgi:hypothetical protein
MCTLHRVRWTITPRFSPQPWIACSGCGTHKPFQSSGKVRLNANGKKLDAWLIYRCCDCEGTWNRPLFERRLARDIEPHLLDALHSNDPAWVRQREFDIAALRRKARQISEFAEVDIAKEASDVAGASAALAIELKVPLPTSLRLDRLLAAELGITRSQINSLYAEGKLGIAPDCGDALRRRIRDGMRIILEARA